MGESELRPGRAVRHAQHGTGSVITDLGRTVVVRFEGGIRECAREDLEAQLSFEDRLARGEWDQPLGLINRLQAEAITSVNDAWGVFTRSRIALLPHQLWVCKEVLKEWPTRWMVADDVGLGKTIEAGMILTPLVAGGRVRRLLILCPASLVEQWQGRLRRMFDLRLAIYTPAADTPKTDFWHTHDQVVVSLHTLRGDRDGRHKRLLESEPWDLVVVDESHHVNADEDAGPTLAYQLVKKLNEGNLVRSMLFFTGTPHRGKSFNFLAQLQLLRPDLFDARKPFGSQVQDLRDAVIRNSKYNVTDLEGKPLFKAPRVSMETYRYSPEEQSFYDGLTDFIVRGRAYASGLPRADQSAVALVLTAMQKLASSSVAAIRRAIIGRLSRLSASVARLRELQRELEELDREAGPDSEDRRAAIEEELPSVAFEVRLMEDEEPWLRKLLEMAEKVRVETKIRTILDVVRERFADRAVLFFTEYKATQSLLMSGLMQEYGDSTVAFINGDDRAEEVRGRDGAVHSFSASREESAAAFNAGEARFLVSTEAGGEGIDLQERCHTLVHVDLPWNPMRLHQRVGRLDRYGQKKCVEVVSVRNPSTVEARIMERLEEKLDEITGAFSFVMDSPEDLKQLVLGMTPSSAFQRIFVKAVDVPRETLSEWFDKETAMLGGKDIVESVRALVGDVRKFDFGESSSRIPKVHLPDLEPFFEGALVLHGRRMTATESGISFLSPDEWRTTPAVRSRYEDMTFDRVKAMADERNRLLGVGHRVVDQALLLARRRDSLVASLPRSILPEPVAVFRILERVTDGPGRQPTICGVLGAGAAIEGRLLADWEVLVALNQLPWRKELMRQPSPAGGLREEVEAGCRSAEALVQRSLRTLVPDYRVPMVELLGALWPRDGAE